MDCWGNLDTVDDIQIYFLKVWQKFHYVTLSYHWIFCKLKISLINSLFQSHLSAVENSSCNIWPDTAKSFKIVN